MLVDASFLGLLIRRYEVLSGERVVELGQHGETLAELLGGERDLVQRLGHRFCGWIMSEVLKNISILFLLLIAMELKLLNSNYE